jgi:hypothetical protein
MNTQDATPHSDSPVLRDPEAARYLNRSASWLRQARMRGEGPVYVKDGRSISFSTGTSISTAAAGRCLNRSLSRHQQPR